MKPDLTFRAYSKERIAAQREAQPFEQALALGVLGLAGEVGEVAEPIKKHLYHGKDLDRRALLSELGDVLWYLNYLTHTLGYSLEDAAKDNNEKLRARYPDGFSKEAAAQRNCEHNLFNPIQDAAPRRPRASMLTDVPPPETPQEVEISPQVAPQATPELLAWAFTGDRDRWRELLTCNPGLRLGEDGKIPWHAGLRLVIPPAWTVWHPVSLGDTPQSLAKRYAGDPDCWGEIMACNPQLKISGVGVESARIEGAAPRIKTVVHVQPWDYGLKVRIPAPWLLRAAAFLSAAFPPAKKQPEQQPEQPPGPPRGNAVDALADDVAEALRGAAKLAQAQDRPSVAQVLTRYAHTIADGQWLTTEDGARRRERARIVTFLRDRAQLAHQEGDRSSADVLYYVASLIDENQHAAGGGHG